MWIKQFSNSDINNHYLEFQGYTLYKHNKIYLNNLSRYSNLVISSQLTMLTATAFRVLLAENLKQFCLL